MLIACGVPVAAPSANTSGKPSPTTALHVYHDLKGKLPLILDGGECQVGLESTVVDMTADIPTVLRPGGVTPEMLLTVLPEVRVADSVMRPLREGERALSPGMRYRHYAPGGELTLVKGSQENVRALCLRMYREAVAAGRSARILAFEEHLSDYAGAQALSIGSLEKPKNRGAPALQRAPADGRGRRGGAHLRGAARRGHRPCDHEPPEPRRRLPHPQRR